MYINLEILKITTVDDCLRIIGIMCNSSDPMVPQMEVAHD